MMRRFVSAITAAVLMAVTTVSYAQQYGSAPSIAPVGKLIAISGGGVAAGSVVSIRVTAPNGMVSVLATTADAQGKFNQGVTAGEPGLHRIELLGADSQRFAELRMMAAAAN